ncbi:hypothetical protein V5O48_016034 [Marasmius crinis-equi]|uniref:Uncharacterized protein n=1 Tax=Marasmius crinis-equi TaxID=585013 RepID=A0ABR3ESW8_9AGAR
MSHHTYKPPSSSAVAPRKRTRAISEVRYTGIKSGYLQGSTSDILTNLSLLFYLTKMAGSIIVRNMSNQDINVFVSKYSNKSGDDNWFALKAGASDSWDRSGWELVAFKNGNDSQRAGVYIQANKSVTFRSFQDIRVN